MDELIEAVETLLDHNDDLDPADRDLLEDALIAAYEEQEGYA
jgi:hypothetical protein